MDREIVILESLRRILEGKVSHLDEQIRSRDVDVSDELMKLNVQKEALRGEIYDLKGFLKMSGRLREELKADTECLVLTAKKTIKKK